MRWAASARLAAAFGFCLLMTAASCGASAEMRILATPWVTLSYDDEVWAPEAALPPAKAMLACIGQPCGRDVVALIIHDPRSIIRPGAGAFSPGALGAALLDARAQSLVPGARARPVSQVEPLRLEALEGYVARYSLEDRELGQRDLMLVAVPLSTGLLAGEVVGPALGDADIKRFIDLMRTARPRL
jgi:hypothetical protein